MATNAGTIVVNLRASTEKFQRGIKKAQNSLKGFGNSTKRFIADNKLAIGLGVGAFVAGIAKVTKAASDLEETQGKFNTVFRGSTEVAEQFAKELQTSYATSEEEAKRFLSTIQDTLVPMGLMRDEATNISGSVVKLAADLGSFNNLPTEEVVKAIQSAMVGNLETVRKFGISLRAASIDQAILNKGMAKSSDEITEAQRVQERLTQIMAGSSDAIGDMARTSESFANQTKKLNAEWNNFLVTLGQFTIGPGKAGVVILTNMVTELNAGIKSISTMSQEFKTFTGFLETNFVAVLGAVALAVLDMIEQIPFVSTIIKKLGGDLDRTRTIIEDQIVAWNATNIASEEAAEKMVGSEDKKQKALIKTKDVLVETKEEEKQFSLDTADALFQDNVKDAQKRMEGEKKFAAFFNTSRKDVADFAMSQANNMFESFGQGTADMILEGRKFGDVIKAIWKDLARAVIAQIAKMIVKWLAFQALKAAATGGFGGFFASGGIISEPSVITGLRSGVTHIAGEAGPEAVVPLDSIRNSSAQRNESAEEIAGGNGGGGGGSSRGGAVNVNVSITGMFIEGNENKWQRLIREKIVPEISRFTMGRPIGPFNRKRGV